MDKKVEEQACCVLPARDLQADVLFYTKNIGFELVALSPSQNPVHAELVGFGLMLRLDTRCKTLSLGCIVIKTLDGGNASSIRSPTGTIVIREPVQQPSTQTVEQHNIEICRLRSSSWISGKAGTQTRELIPSRLGGGIVATHIRITNGGAVADKVHYHTANFQLVFCVRGWITLVYEDQGDPITLQAGDCVTQPPHIRHRVLETSNGLEVLEIGLPGEHITAIDNELELPTARIDSHRLFDGQRFCHFSKDNAKWQRHRLPGFLYCDTGVSHASGAMVGARLLKATHLPAAIVTRHTANILFSFVLSGSVRIDKQLLVAGDAYTLPPHVDHTIGDISDDASILEVSAPGEFETHL